ncbi:LacI family DNA-binding transcriptional regulator [Vagococcus acidifermentans]|uniref:Uncharacterized protein n=1 Tax=Vagococcus acidifermentans TaxID=564710 RepID=A0A430B2E4_9ENTE|nr:LacI family DNA-binding transcriptional regulator [Vagococcus acidifermentans]RSU14507.1 hypothetical protein CBF27_00535 [Vagococcus acidifermentans]
MKKNVTILDVAKQAGVSKTTVSRYLNGHFGNMSSETKERIRQVIAELNYRPNKQAQALKSKRSYLIGVVVSDISNMYSSLLLKGIGEVLGEAGYQMIIMDAASSLEQEHDLLNKLTDQSVEGIILQASSRDASHYSHLKQANMPLILVDRDVEPSLFPLVTSDNIPSTQKIIEVILQKNYEQVVVVSEPLKDIVTRELRYAAAEELVVAAGRKIKLIEKTPEMDLTEPVVRLAASPLKTALFASNGRMLMELLTILVNEKIRIPEDIGITGFDDWNLSALVGPGITSIEQQSKQIGEEAAKMMLDYIQYGSCPVETKIIPTNIQLRHSL